MRARWLRAPSPYRESEPTQHVGAAVTDNRAQAARRENSMKKQIGILGATFGVCDFYYRTTRMPPHAVESASVAEYRKLHCRRQLL